MLYRLGEIRTRNVSGEIVYVYICYVFFGLLYRTLGFMQIPDFFRSITEIVI
jgi:hypothetical protein